MDNSIDEKLSTCLRFGNSCILMLLSDSINLVFLLFNGRDAISSSKDRI